MKKYILLAIAVGFYFLFAFNPQTVQASLASTTYTGKFISISSYETMPAGLSFNNDGTKMFFAGRTTHPGAIYQFALSVPWDVSTAVFTASSSVAAAQIDSPNGLTFKSDGTKMYISSLSSNRIYEYNLTSAWDITTAEFNNNFFNFGNGSAGIFFRPGGNKLYVIRGSSVDQYSLSVAWDISTAVADNKTISVFSQERNPSSLFFKGDGTKMYVLGVHRRIAYEFNLTVPWDVSTAIYTNGNNFDLNSQISNGATGAATNATLDQMYVLGVGASSAAWVFQYNFSGMVGYWPLDEGSGTTAVDYSGYGNNGAWQGLDPYYTTGKAGAYGGLFDKYQNNQFVEVADTSTLNFEASAKFSASVWIKPTGWYPWNAILTKGNYNDSAGWIIYIKESLYNRGIICYDKADYSSDCALNTGYIIPLNTWTHVAVTNDNGAANIYINGSLVASGNVPISDAIANLNIGKKESNSENFIGAIDEVKVFNQVLSSGDVLNIYQNTAINLPTILPSNAIVNVGVTSTIVSTGADHIYYTIDGSTPTTTSLDYILTGPFAINGPLPQTVKAYATKNGSVDSQVATKSFNTSTAYFTSGDGLSASTAFEISDCQHLQYIGSDSYFLSKYYKVTADFSCAIATAEGGDLYNSGSGFNPIGDVATAFSGHFDGQNYTISGLSINRSSTSYVGLFGYVTGGSIANVKLADVNVSGYDRVGGLVGRLYIGGSVTNAQITGVVTGESAYVGGLVGGAVGNVYNSRANVTVVGHSDFTGGLIGGASALISGSFSSGSVTQDEYGVDASVGGLAGVVSATGVVSNCSSTATVSGVYAAGGLVGSSLGNISNSSASGDVTVRYEYGGGLVGSLSGDISNSHASGNVYGGWDLGGLVGVADNAPSGRGNITNSYATGVVSSTNSNYWFGGLVGSTNAVVSSSWASGVVNAPNGYKVGGLIGGSAGQVYFTSSTGAVTGDSYVGGLIGYSVSPGSVSSSFSNSGVSGGSYTGGLVGYNDNATIEIAYATGDVTVSGDRAGGLVGWNRQGKVENTYATGDVTASGNYIGGLVGFNGSVFEVSILNSYALGTVTGLNYVGGLVGVNNNDDIQNSFAVGNIVGLSDGFYQGFVGYDYTNESSLYTNNFWYNNKDRGINSEFGFEDEIIGRWEKAESASVFKNTSTVSPFVDNWDFENVWLASVGNYPVLRAFSDSVTADLFDGGAGTISSPYQINTCEQLQNISTDSETLAAHYILTNSINCSNTVSWNPASGHCSNVNKNYNTQVTCEGDGYTWTTSSFYKGFNPIGCGRVDEMCWDRPQSSFTGVLDGNDKEISNLYINRREYYIGLFGAIGAGAEVKNLNIINANINSIGSVDYVGVLSGFLSSESAINSVNITGALNASESTFIGGVSGYHDYQEECFLAGTPILMQDGSHKNIESIKIGEVVVSYDEINSKKLSGTVAKTFIHQVDHYLLINNFLKVTTNHPLYVNGKWLAAGNVHIGDALVDENGKIVKVNSIVKIFDNVTVYNLEVNPQIGGGFESCGPGHSYFAGGILAHNKCPVIATDDGTGYKFNTKINVFNEGKANEKIFKYKMNTFSNGVVKMSYDPYDIDYVNYVAIEISDTKGANAVVYKLEPVSCSGNGCDVSLLKKIDNKYLILDKNNTEVSLDFGTLPSLPTGYTRSFQIISSGYQKVLKQSHFFDYPDEISKWFRGYFDWHYSGAHHTISTSSAKVIISGWDYVGGISGFNAGDIVNSYSTSLVTGNKYLGGIAGYSSGNILGSYSTGNIYGYNQEVGGVVGKNVGVVRNSYATGNVASENDYVGGLIGMNMSNVYASYSTGNVTGTSNVGGFAGANAFGNIYSSFSTAQSVVGSGEYVGGFIGSSPDPHPNTGWITLADMPAIGIESSDPVTTIDYNETGASAFYTATHGVYTAGDNIWDFTNIWESHTNYLPTLRGISANSVSTTYFTLTYSASSGGTISGSSSQYLANGSTGSSVIAVANSGYRFSKWSEDNSTSASRSDIASSNQTFTAVFQSSGGGGSVTAPVGIGTGIVDKVIPMNQTGVIGTITPAGVNYLSYIGSNAGFDAVVSHDNTIENHHLIINNLDLSSNVVEFTIQSTPQKVKLKLGQTTQVDLDNDKIKDVEVKFTNIWVNRAELTIKSLLGIKEVKTQTTLPVTGVSISKYIFKRDLKFGMTGVDVKELQKYLNSNGYIIAKSGTGAPGKEVTNFGNLTKVALVKFQKANDLTANGKLDTATRYFINGESLPEAISQVTPVNTTSNTSVFKFTRDLKLGMNGNDVKELQKYLNNSGFLVDSTGIGSPSKENNYFGKLTQNALIKFQQANKITPAVGNLGSLTRKVINSK